MNHLSSPEPFVARIEAVTDLARLRLLVLLESEELSVTELADVLQMPQSTVSRHLKQLVERGWVVSRGERTANLYRMVDGELDPAARRFWELTRGEVAGWSQLEHDRLRLERRLAERGGDARSFYAGVAQEWERLRAELYGHRFNLAALAALLPREWVVADLACGAGDVTVELAPRVARVIAVDGSPEMLDAARRRARGLGNVELHRADLEELPIGDGSCDAALMLLALTHVGDPAAAVAEMARILRPGGRAIVVDLLRHDRDEFRRRLGQLRNGFGADELAGLLSTAELEVDACSPLPPEAEAKGPALLLASATRPAHDSLH